MPEVDKDQKTEAPSAKRLAEARRKGDVVKSQEVNHWFMITAAALVIAIFADHVAAGIRDQLVGFLASVHDMAADPSSLQAMFRRLSESVAVLMIAPLAILIAAAVAANLVQHQWIWALEKLKPKFSSFNLVTGLKKKFSLTTVADFLKDILKLVVVGSVVLVLIWPERGRLLDLVGSDVGELMSLIKVLTLRILIAVIVIVGVIAIADYFYQRYDHRKQLRMTKQEVKDERKQMEGDPKIKQKLHSIRVSRLRQRMMAAVPEADVVITNPTHYAVALAYEAETMAAPKVVAKGRDLLALRIRDLAEDNGVPLVENPPLARALHDSAEVGQEIPVAHYKAVAEVIGYIMRAQGGLRSQRQGV